MSRPDISETRTTDPANARMAKRRPGPQRGRFLKGASASLEREFQPHLLAIQETPPAPFMRIILWSLLVLMVAILIWSYLGHIPIMTSAPGRFVSDARTKVLQTLNAGTVERILAKPGDFVHAGQALVELNTDTNRANLEAQKRMLALNDMRARRLRAELAGSATLPTPGETAGSAAMLERQVQAAELAHHRAQLATDKARIQEAQAGLEAGRVALDEYTQRATLASRLAREAAPLAADGAISGAHYDQLRDSAMQAEGRLAAQHKQVAKLEKALEAAQKSLVEEQAKFTAGLYQNLEATVDSGYDIHRKHAEAARQYHLDWIRAPVDGYVQNVGVASLGTVVQPGQTLATVVPANAPLVVEADVASQNTGFIKAGQTVDIKIMAYPFQQYGKIPGRVTWVSPTSEVTNGVAAPPPGESHQSAAAGAPPLPASGAEQGTSAVPPVLYYRVHVKPERNWLMVDGQKQPMRSGMTVTVDIHTGQRRVINFFLDPIVKHLGEGVQVR